MERKNLFRRIMALTVGAAMALSLSACVNKTPEPAEPVTAEAAITRLQEQREALGFDNALDELQEKHTAQIGGDTYIRLQQYYEGLPVYGRTLVYAADEQGALTSLTGNVQDVDPALDLTPTITAEQALDSIRTYASETLKIENAQSISVELQADNLYIYTDTDPHTLVYSVIVGADRVILDAHNANILSWQSIFMQDEVWYSGPEGTKSVRGIDPIGDRYCLKDAQRNIYVYDARGQIYWYPGTGNSDSAMFPGVPTLVTSADTVFGDDNDSTASSDIAYVFLNELGAVYDFFAEMGETGVGTYVGIFNDLMNNPNNPTTGYQGRNAGGYCGPLAGIIEEEFPDTDTPLSEIRSAVIIMGSAYNQDMGSARDTIGHEYQHTVFQKYVGASNSDGESGAIDEGIADIMGELYQSSRSELDWEHGRRMIRDPSQNGYPESVSEINSDLLTRLNTDFSHGCSTVISHSAYLMWNGIDGDASKKLSENELAELWYRAVLMMPSDCDFILCRQLVEAAAQSMEALSDEQRAGIRQAFDQVQIPATREDDFHADYNLAEDCTLSVYDRNKELHGGYTLRINGAIDLAEIASTTMPDVGWVINRTVTVEEPGPYKLDLPRGFYALTITDRYCDEEYTIYVKIHEDHTETNIDLITAYEKPLIVVIPEIDYEHLVTDAYRDTFTDNYGYDYCYHIPRFNLNGNLTDPVNQKLYDQFYDILDEHVYDSIDQYSDTSISSILYSWGHHDDLASVVIQTRMTWEYAEYQACTISTATGQEVSSGEILAAYGMDDAAFRTLVSSRLSQYWEGRREYRDQVGAEFFDECMGRTLAVSNIKNAVPFINPDGGLSFIANIYSFAGADSYLHLINAEGAFHMDEPECSWDHSADKPKPTGDTLQYFIENCDKLYFTEADIQDFDDEMCMYARNAIFAKSGRKFQSQTLQDYFGQYSWYLPRVEPDAFTDDMLNRKQLKNLAVIQAREQTLEIESLMESLGGEAGIYTRYLHSGGYTELLGWDVDTDNLEVVSCLADLDNDGTKELYLSLRTGSHGIRGMEEFTYLLDIWSGQVVTAAECYFGGGSMGGDTLEIRYDTQTQTHVLVLDGYIRDGVEAFASYLNIYSEPGFQVGREHTESYYSLYNDWYKENVDKIRRETTLYYEDGYDFRCFQIDGQYVTEEAYEAALARYEQPREGFQPKAATYANPVS